MPRTFHASSVRVQHPKAGDKSSPLWHCPVFRTIPDWNLPATIAETDSLSVFKSRLAAPKP